MLRLELQILLHHGRVGVEGFACAHRFLMSIYLNMNELVMLIFIIEFHCGSFQLMKSCI
ncbi:hypothetical protein BN130_1925 [Cronobacter malonaticus 507]|nr:hypothetical protein BN130_1925 [Cronobacter malonaticus 507]